MIYTVTCNPALDWVMRLDDFSEGATNRSKLDSLTVGGKGINVSIMLHRLGLDTCALGFLAGITGDAIEAGLAAEGIAADFIRLPAGNSRINVKLKRGGGTVEGAEGEPGKSGKSSLGEGAAAESAAGKGGANAGDAALAAPLETEINGRGPEVGPEAQAELIARLGTLGADDVLVLSGSAAPGCDERFYAYLVDAVRPAGVRVVVDATGPLLAHAVAAGPFLVKPNNEELAALADCDADDEAALVEAARHLARDGARYVLVSCGAVGAFLADADGLIARQAAPRGVLVNSVGAGDSMVAGFLAGLAEGSGIASPAAAPGTSAPAGSAAAPGTAHRAAAPEMHALRLAVAAGSATAFSLGLATDEEVRAQLPALR